MIKGRTAVTTRYNPVSQSVIEELKRIVGAKNVITDPDRLAAYSHDETPADRYGHMPEVAFIPRTAEEISRVLRLANRELIPITPRGAGSGLSGGAIPVFGGIVISTEKMNRILEIDEKNMVAVVEPGVVTNEINDQVAQRGLFFAGYPMSLETCSIGGNVAENAGGGKAVKYGVTGRYVMGIEVVLPTGEIIMLGGKRVKDVTGYDLKQLIVGSEGTLGIITKIIVKLLPLPTARIDLLVLFKNVRSAIDMVWEIMTQAHIVPTTVEFMDALSFHTSLNYLNEQIDCKEAGAMILIEVDGNDFERLEAEAETIGELCLSHGAKEVYVADNATTQERVWGVRRSIPEAFMASNPDQSIEDIVVPIASIPQLMPELARIAQMYGIQIPCYGHAADGNLHATLIRDPVTTEEEWIEKEQKALRDLYSVVQRFGGAISGEHGIGSKRKKYFMEGAINPTLVVLMRRIKKAFDPKGIMNPGKIFDLE